jgi:hypothetical protein
MISFLSHNPLPVIDIVLMGTLPNAILGIRLAREKLVLSMVITDQHALVDGAYGHSMHQLEI